MTAATTSYYPSHPYGLSPASSPTKLDNLSKAYAEAQSGLDEQQKQLEIVSLKENIAKLEKEVKSLKEKSDDCLLKMDLMTFNSLNETIRSTNQEIQYQKSKLEAFHTTPAPKMDTLDENTAETSSDGEI